MIKYALNILWSEEDSEFVATCPAFPGLSALGETEEEALAEAKIALSLFIKTCEEQGIPLPVQEAVQEFSGQFRVRLPKSIHRQAVQMAEHDRISLNQFVNNAIVAALNREETARSIASEIRRQLAEHANQMRVAIASVVSSDERVISKEITETTVSSKTEKVVYRRQGRGN
ncbi:MAG: toxin-antitoxin system HicB family antitoxin [Acidobacteriota bacterium]|nr:toxin-antitoxin system HicB family antitoxin [Acidobacteriota bacterium]